MARFYKVINIEKKAAAKKLYDELQQMRKDNFEAVKKLVPFPWDKYFGHGIGFTLIPTFIGFVPKEGVQIETPTGWRVDKKNNCLVPDKKTKEGKIINKALEDLPNVFYDRVYKDLGIDAKNAGRSFSIPYVMEAVLQKPSETTGDPLEEKEIYVQIDEKIELEEQDFEEVTTTYVRKMLNQ